MKNVIVIGNGGHSKVVQEMIRRTDGYILSGILDQKIDSYHEIEGMFIDSTNNIEKYKVDYHFVIGIGDNYVRQKIFVDNNLLDENFSSIIDSNTVLAADTEIGVGTVVMPGVIINPGSKIGKHSILNTGSVIEHDNTIGDFVHISPNATLAGTVTIDDFVHVGAGATVIPNKTVNKHSIVGAGAVVINDIEENSLAVGVPAKVVKRRLNNGE